MPDFNAGYATGRIHVNGDEIKAMLAWRRIEQRGTVVRLYRAGAYLPEQTVRVEYSTGAPKTAGSDVSRSSERDVILFGVRGHPWGSVIDTDIAVGDRFVLAGETITYQVESVVTLPGEVQATAVVSDG